jgi:hypothetical protein
MSNDFTSTLVLNLQQRVICMENTIGFLTREVHRLSQLSTPHVQQQGFQTTIPLQPAPQGRRPYLPQRETAPHTSLVSQSHTQSHAQSQSHTQSQHEENVQPITLSELLNRGEVVTFGIHTGRDAAGGMTTSLLTTTFDGTNLNVTGCDAVSSLIGTQSAKPGEILFKFMHGLVDAGLLQRTFNALPWRLATVMRNGLPVTLAQLRRIKQEDAQNISV